MLKGILHINDSVVELNMYQVQRLRNFVRTDLAQEPAGAAIKLLLYVVDEPEPSPGKAAYEAWGQSPDLSGLSVPPLWRELEPEERKAWEAIAESARDFAR